MNCETAGRGVCSLAKQHAVPRLSVRWSGRDAKRSDGIVCRSHRHTRRENLAGVAGLAGFLIANQPAEAIGFKKELKKKKLSESDYDLLSSDGLKMYDLVEGKGAAVGAGSKVVVHYDCKFRGIDVVSSRSARLLGGNRVVAEPFEFTAGEGVIVGTKIISDRGGGGLFTGDGGPSPPPALSTAVIGMKEGGKRSVLVPPEAGYGEKGVLEIPPNAQFELQIELLELR
ncbi:hypothetical protein BSKO_13581 [Bryopsis sp. KO-2023]|nr:hypothetical protein BSKO_13581 [Bryopsis sp. KO-2023]